MTSVVEIKTNEYVVIDDAVITTVDIEKGDVVIVSEEKIELVSEGLQGPAGAKGDKGDKGDPGGTEFVRTAAVALGGHRAVLINSAGKVDYATNADVTHATRVVGITTGAASAEALVNIAQFGEVTEPSWSWDTNFPVYLGENGVLTQTPPSAPAKFSVVVGFPISSTTLFVNIREPIILAN